jgi:hypothetical protein
MDKNNNWKGQKKDSFEEEGKGAKKRIKGQKIGKKPKII